VTSPGRPKPTARTQHAAVLIIFLTMAQAEEGIGHVKPLRVVTEEVGFGAAAEASSIWSNREEACRIV
jgi:hypothetical protein